MCTGPSLWREFTTPTPIPSLVARERRTISFHLDACLFTIELSMVILLFPSHSQSYYRHGELIFKESRNHFSIAPSINSFSLSSTVRTVAFRLIVAIQRKGNSLRWLRDRNEGSRRMVLWNPCSFGTLRGRGFDSLHGAEEWSQRWTENSLLGMHQHVFYISFYGSRNTYSLHVDSVFCGSQFVHWLDLRFTRQRVVPNVHSSRFLPVFSASRLKCISVTSVLSMWWFWGWCTWPFQSNSTASFSKLHPGSRSWAVHLCTDSPLSFT